MCVILVCVCDPCVCVGRYDRVPLTLPISRLTNKVIEEGKISSLQLQVIEKITHHPNLGAGDAVSLFKFLLHLTHSKGSNAIACMGMVLSMLERVSEDEEAVRALSSYHERSSGARVGKRTRKADFLQRIDLFLQQREDFNFVSKNLDEQFEATVRVDQPRGRAGPQAALGSSSNKENYASAMSPATRYSKHDAALASPDLPRGLRGSASENRARTEDSRYNARRGGGRAGEARSALKEGGAEAGAAGRRKMQSPAVAKPQAPSRSAAAAARREREREKKAEKAPSAGKGPPPAKAKPKPKKEVSKKEAREMKERHRREIEEIKLRRERKQLEQKRKEQERLDKEELLRLKHIEKRNKIVKRMSAPARAGPAPAKGKDAKIIHELVIEALNRRLEVSSFTRSPRVNRVRPEPRKSQGAGGWIGGPHTSR